MWKKGSWILALKRVFTSTSKDKILVDVSDGEFVKEKKKWAIGKLRHGGTKPFIHLHKEPSSIEQILGDAEREHYGLQHHAEPPKKPLHRSSTEDRALGNAEMVQAKTPPAPPKRAQQPRTPPNPTSAVAYRPAISPSRIAIRQAHKSAIKIQAAYRGYMARKNYRGLRGLVRLQGVMRGHNVKRQTMTAMRLMQLFVKVQSQVRMRRMQAMEGQNPQRQATRLSEKEQDSNVSKWSLSHKSDAEEQAAGEEWDASLLTQEEADARLQRKMEAILKRERALAYASSHQLLKAPPKSPRSALAELRSGGVPLWWSWLERRFLQAHQPAERAPTPPAKGGAPPTPRNWGLPDAQARPGSRGRLSRVGPESPETYRPASSHDVARGRGPPSTPGKVRHPPPSRAASVRPAPRDDESLTSCPALAVPGYMAPTLSAKAKVREQGFQRDGPPAEAKRRFSFGLSQSIGTLRWSKGGLFAPKDSSGALRGKHRPMSSTGNLSVDLASLPAGVGRKPFK